MFKVKSKQTNKIYIVYGVIPELTITWFLIFDDNNIVDINDYLWVDINVIKIAYENNKQKKIYCRRIYEY